MRLLSDLTELRKQTIAFWSTFSYPGNEVDIARVYAFRELDPATATDADVSRAYGGDGWAPQTPCTECGAPAAVEVGRACLCASCLTTASQLLAPTTSAPAPAGMFSRLFNKG